MWEGGAGPQEGYQLPWAKNGFTPCSRYLGRKGGHVIPGPRFLVPLVCVGIVVVSNHVFPDPTGRPTWDS